MQPSRGRAAAAARVLLLAGAAACGDPRQQATDELLRLHVEMERHATRFGRLPDTLDPEGPEGAANLPFSPRNGVRVELQGAAGRQYFAVAHRGGWRCWVVAMGERRSIPDCARAEE